MGSRLRSLATRHEALDVSPAVALVRRQPADYPEAALYPDVELEAYAGAVAEHLLATSSRSPTAEEVADYLEPRLAHRHEQIRTYRPIVPLA